MPSEGGATGTVVLSVCHYAEGGATELGAKTSNTRRTRYLLGSDLKKFGFKASFASYGVTCLP